VPRRKKPRPNEFVVEEKRGLYGQRDFGKAYVMPPGGTDAQAGAARIQHEVAMHARAACNKDPEVEDTDAHLAAASGVKREFGVRKLNGQSAASLEDIIAWTLASGIEVFPVVQNRSDLVPTKLMVSTRSARKKAAKVAKKRT
jgi:hypothetical protein